VYWDGGDCGELLKVIVFRDSFCNAMLLAVNIVDADPLSSVT